VRHAAGQLTNCLEPLAAPQMEIAVLEPLGPAAALSPELSGRLAAYAAALARWRDAAFAEAARGFAALTEDGPARHFAAQAAALAARGAPPGWEPITTLQEK